MDDTTRRLQTLCEFLPTGEDAAAVALHIDKQTTDMLSCDCCPEPVVDKMHQFFRGLAGGWPEDPTIREAVEAVLEEKNK
jgi:hypothetical protein